MDVEVATGAQIDAQAWNRRVAQVAQGGFRQTFWYGDFKAHWREEALYFIARDCEGRIVGQLLAICGSPWGWALERRPLPQLTQPLARWLVPRLYWHEGPLVFVERGADQVRHALLDAVVSAAKVRRCLTVEGQSSHFDPNERRRAAFGPVANRMGWNVDRRTTLAIDLEQDEESLWSNVRKEARTKVRKARKQDIEIVEVAGDEERLALAHSVVVETAARNGVASLSIDEFRHSHKYHSEVGVERSFISLHEGVPLSFQKVICHNGNALLGGVAYSDYSRDQRLYGNDLMQWHIVEQGRAAGWRWLDFGGAEPDSPDPKMQGIFRFKAKWGGQLLSADRMRQTLGVAGRLQGLLPKKLHRLVIGGSA
ncbi:MAG: peptidoglycan bridge formation glycyltransferase FemA/FemB family protein [Candidatus Latescibacteria bacterium]|nr:peptidoglycan bridge formation glycyltransferase FemA/FemB family protein [Candidatus Latescibacterota bacterium]